MYWLGAGKSTFIEQLGRNRQSIYVYIYVYVYICTHTHLFIYIYNMYLTKLKWNVHRYHHE